MGYDYGNDCDELYTSYNYSWYFYHYLDKEQGLRFIYGKRGRDVLLFLLKMRQDLQGSPAWLTTEEDGWNHTVGNCIYFINQIIASCIKSPMGKWYGD